MVPGPLGCEAGAVPLEPAKPLIFDRYDGRYRVQFGQGLPRPGQSLADALEGGRGDLDQVIALLKGDFISNAQLSAHASHEGDPQGNRALTDRRLALVRAELTEVAWKVRDPQPAIDDLTGCEGTWGAYSCGDAKADRETLRPADRNVTLLVFSPAVLAPSGTFPGTGPKNPWTSPIKPGPSWWPQIGPF